MLQPGEVAVVNTGLALQLPPGTYARLAPRSGLSLRDIWVNAGVIDKDYLGCIKVVLKNCSKEPYIIARGDFICQLICERIKRPCVIECNDIVTRITVRGDGGFGSSDIDEVDG